MKNLLNNLSQGLETFANSGVDSLESLLSRQTHNVIITGLSRSGKSMFFTTLMTLFGQRANSANGTSDHLPLLSSLPLDLVESFELRPISGEESFPIDDCLAKLQNQQWPASTDQVYGFELVLTLRQTRVLKRLINKTNKVVFRFYDYPGEWLTDLPMLHKEFVHWSDSAWSQQSNPPQKFYAQGWQAFVEQFDFDLSPESARVEEYIQNFRHYLQTAKDNGITLLQPGSMLMEAQTFNWTVNGFAPLPSSVSSDPEHPWTRLFNENFELFKKLWLKPLQENYFLKADKQIIMLDLHEGLSHSRAHLNQLKETISNLANSFVYGADKWYKPKILFGDQISKVAFVATKSDLIPHAQQGNFLKLLQEITSGVRAHLKDHDVDFQHFLISAIQVTDPGECENCLRFTDTHNDYQEWELEPLPCSLKELEPNQTYPVMPAAVPKDVMNRMYHAQGIDRLIEYLIKT